MATQDDYAATHIALLPPGKAWAGPNLRALLAGLAGVCARIDQRMADLQREADPRQTVEGIDNWESNLGLPDECIGQLATLQERQAAAAAKYLSDGGQSKPYFIALAASLGYDITIDEFRPFTCGLSRCGDGLAVKASRFYWRVNVPDARFTPFTCGKSRCGEKLGSIRRADDLECVFDDLQPADKVLIFSYTGV